MKRWLVRWRYRWALWRSLDAMLNRRAAVEEELFLYSETGGCPPEDCKRLALKLGNPNYERSNSPH